MLKGKGEVYRLNLRLVYWLIMYVKFMLIFMFYVFCCFVVIILMGLKNILIKYLCKRLDWLLIFLCLKGIFLLELMDGV